MEEGAPRGGWKGSDGGSMQGAGRGAVVLVGGDWRRGLATREQYTVSRPEPRERPMNAPMNANNPDGM